MNALEIKQGVENFNALLVKREQLENKLHNSAWRNPEMEMKAMQKLEDTEQLIEIIDRSVYESKYLTDKESCILGFRVDGYRNKEIAKVFLLNRNRTGRILNEIYEKMAKNYTEIL